MSGEEDALARAESAMEVVKAPWDHDQINHANTFQQAGVMHPFTCGVDSSHPLLVARRSGWRCPTCDYTQDWAFAGMLDGSIVEHMQKTLGILGGPPRVPDETPSNLTIGEVGKQVAAAYQTGLADARRRPTRVNVVIAIGNSDNHLTQEAWSRYWHSVDGMVENLNDVEVHGRWMSEANSRYQNAAWSIVLSASLADAMKESLADVAAAFEQDTIAWLEGTTEMIESR